MTTNILTAVVTAYIATGHPCANGAMPRVAYTIAVPRRFVLGSEVIVNGRRYVAEDRTAQRFDGRFDIFVANRRDALLWGKKTLKLTVITK